MHYYYRIISFITVFNLATAAELELVSDDVSIAYKARALVEEEQYQEALPYFEKALACTLNDIQLMFEYANALNTLNQTEKALAIYQHLLIKRPNDIGILYNTAYTLKKLGNPYEALPYYQKVLDINPHHAEAHFSLSLALLLRGNFKQGWKEYEWRWKRNIQLTPRNFTQPLWTGEQLTGKTIFLHAEQGLGDTFQFIRYAKIIKEKYNGTVIVAVQKPLQTIISNCCPFIDKVITFGQIPAQYDVQAPLMSLPYILQTDESTIPANIPYIFPDQALVQLWQKKLASDSQIKIGLCWQGNSNYSTTFLRSVVAAKSININTFTPLAKIPGISFYSLQKQTGVDQLSHLDKGFQLYIFDDSFDAQYGRFMDTAAVIKNFDLIITVDTSIAHLAGAIGTPVWLLLPEPADWRWLLCRTDSPWYPHTRLFRQRKSGDWDTVIQEIIQELTLFVAQKNNTASSEDSLAATITMYEKKLQENPDDATTHFAYGTYLADLDQPIYHQSAWYHLHQAITLNNDQLQWLFSYGTFCCRIGKFKEALKIYQLLLTKNPNAIPILYNSGYTLKLAGHLDLALKIYNKIITIQPDYEPARLALALALLYKGDFNNGWAKHAWNLQKQEKNADILRFFLQTNTLHNKKILLTPEGGFGDTIQFIRYAQRLHNMGAYIIVVVQKELIPLLSGCSFIDQLLPLHTVYPPHDASASLMSLPAVFTDTQETMPLNIPYIFTPKDRVDYWRNQLSHDTHFKIGICWQPSAHNDSFRLPIARRNIPFSLVSSIGLLQNITLYSLQQKEGVEQIQEIFPDVNFHIFDTTFDNTYGHFIDTAAVMESLDLIITTDSAVAHIAGAMGKKVWLLLPYVTDWRWIHNRTDSPWYPTMRIFKQQSPFDWHSVIRDVRQTLLTDYKEYGFNKIA